MENKIDYIYLGKQNKVSMEAGSINFPKYVLINTGYAKHNADWNYKRVVSPFTRIYMVEEGSAKIYLSDDTLNLVPGYLYIVPANAMHNYECNGHFCLYYIHIYEEDTKNPSIGENYRFQNQIPITELDAMLIKRLNEINSDKELASYNPQQYDNYSHFISSISNTKHDCTWVQMETNGIIQILMSRLLKYATFKGKKYNNRISQALLYIRTNLDKPIEVEELAGLSCVTPEYFSKIFTEQLGVSPIKYIQTKKIQRAQFLLTLNHMPIKEIAYSVGFSDISYFNRVFKKIVGCTPSEYGKQNSSI